MQRSRIYLSRNMLKIIAVIAMTFDHIGVQLFPGNIWLRVIGRLAFPIFAYMIAEGCTYTKNRAKYLGLMSAVAVVCQLVYWFAERSLYQCVMVTFTLSIMLIYALDNARKRKSFCACFAAVLVCIGIIFVTEGLPRLLPQTDYAVDYGIWGVALPASVFFGKNKVNKLIWFFGVLVLLSVSMGGIQWLSLYSVVLLALYSGQRGKYKLKYFFYIYYPLHLVLIYIISLFINC